MEDFLVDDANYSSVLFDLFRSILINLYVQRRLDITLGKFGGLYYILAI
jgi:hypothetical protein